MSFLQLPSPSANGPSEVMVVRITAQRLAAVPYNYREKRWDERPDRTLDVPIRGPKAAAARTE